MHLWRLQTFGNHEDLAEFLLGFRLDSHGNPQGYSHFAVALHSMVFLGMLLSAWTLLVSLLFAVVPQSN